MFNIEEGKEGEAIDTTVEGIYTITYSAVEAAGNEAKEMIEVDNDMLPEFQELVMHQGLGFFASF